MKHHSFQNAAVRIAGTTAVCEFLAPIFDERALELLVALYCDDQTRVIQMLSYPGTFNQVAFPLAHIVRAAIEVGAKGLIIAHNHPSGDNRPSIQDMQLTKKLALALEPLEVVLLDHIIFDGSVFSFRWHGLL